MIADKSVWLGGESVAVHEKVGGDAAACGVWRLLRQWRWHRRDLAGAGTSPFCSSRPYECCGRRRVSSPVDFLFFVVEQAARLEVRRRNSETFNLRIVQRRQTVPGAVDRLIGGCVHAKRLRLVA